MVDECSSISLAQRRITRSPRWPRLLAGGARTHTSTLPRSSAGTEPPTRTCLACVRSTLPLPQSAPLRSAWDEVTLEAGAVEERMVCRALAPFFYCSVLLELWRFIWYISSWSHITQNTADTVECDSGSAVSLDCFTHEGVGMMQDRVCTQRRERQSWCIQRRPFACRCRTPCTWLALRRAL